MEKYICHNCSREFNRKAHLEQHLNKKFHCVSKHIKIQENPKKSEKIQENPKIKVNELMSLNLVNQNLTCQYCFRSFYQLSNLNKHLKLNCKIKKQYDNEKKEIFKELLLKDSIIKEKDEQINKILEQNQQLIFQIEKLTQVNKNTNLKYAKSQSKCKSKSVKISKNITNNTTNINNTNNNNSTNISNNNNIVLFNFGKEDLCIIDKKQYINRVIKNNISGVKIPEEILKLIHFNPQYPQLSNIYISDINREKCMVYEDNQWKLSPVDKIPEVIDRVVEYSYDRDEELRELYKNNKYILDRLNIISKYVKMNDSDYLETLHENDVYGKNNTYEIKRCDDFQKKTYNTFKTTMYNEGKNLKLKK